MKLIISGAESPIGKDLLELLRQQGVGFSLLPDNLLQAADHSGLDQLISNARPDQLINLNTFEPGSQRALVLAETARRECTSIQKDYATLLAGLCEHHDIPMLHLSNCYVFDGDKRLGYNEQDDTGPLGVYGTTALLGERAVQKLARHVIVRSGWLFGKRQYDEIDSWIQSCKQQKGNLQVLQRRFSPTPSEDMARVVLAICRQVDCEASVWGTYHYSGLETKKEIEFVQQVLKYASQHDEQIYQFLDNFTMTEVPPEPPEIANATLSSKKIFDTFGIKQRSWHGSLQTTIKAIYHGGDRGDRPEPEASQDAPDNVAHNAGSGGLH